MTFFHTPLKFSHSWKVLNAVSGMWQHRKYHSWNKKLTFTRSLGSPARKNPDLEDCRKIEIGYTHAAAEAFANSLVPPLKSQGKTFRFVYLSGALAERDTNKKLWFMHDSRTIKVFLPCSLINLKVLTNNYRERQKMVYSPFKKRSRASRSLLLDREVFL